MGCFKAALAIAAMLLAAPGWAEQRDGHSHSDFERQIERHDRWHRDSDDFRRRHHGHGNRHEPRPSRSDYYNQRYDAPATVYGELAPAFAMHILARDVYIAFH